MGMPGEITGCWVLRVLRTQAEGNGSRVRVVTCRVGSEKELRMAAIFLRVCVYLAEKVENGKAKR